MNPAADIARAAAEVAGRIILEAAGSGHATDKGLPGDYVTQVDLAGERAIAQVLEERSPGVPMLGEESGRSGDLGGFYWVVDPLDGTTNFLHGFPALGVSVALVQGGAPVAGAIHTPFLSQTYVAGVREGAWLTTGSSKSRRLRVSDREPSRALVATGFPFRRKDRLPRYLRALTGALERFEDLRRPGAASLDLAWTGRRPAHPRGRRSGFGLERRSPLARGQHPGRLPRRPGRVTGDRARARLTPPAPPA